MTPIDPKDIWIERLNRNAELEKYILDEYKGDISFLFNRKEPEHKLMNKYIRLKKVLLYITGDILPSLKIGASRFYRKACLIRYRFPLHGHTFPTVRWYLSLLMPYLLWFHYNKVIEYLPEPCMEHIDCSIVIPVYR